MNTSAESHPAHNGPSQGHDDAHKSPERLEQEVNQTRARIEDRLVSLTHRLSPGELLDQALGMAREHGGEFTHNLGAQMKQNPVPLLLTGIGLTWLMMGSRANGAHYSQSRYGTPEYAGEYPSGYRSTGDVKPGMVDKAKHAVDNLSERAHALKDQAQEAAGRIGEHASDANQRAQQMGRSMGDRVERTSHSMHEHSAHMRDRIQSSQQELNDFFREQPVLAGGLGMALGAALGALLPPTETEDRLMGDTSADTVDKARAAASERFAATREKASETVKGAVETFKEDLHELQQDVHAAAQDSDSSDGQLRQGSVSADAQEDSARNNPSIS